MRYRPVDSTSPMMLSSAAEDVSDSENIPSSSFNMRITNEKETCTDKSISSPRITPLKKKCKQEVIVKYPEEVPIPSKSLLGALYTAAVAQDDSHQNELDDVGCGLLSMEEVLLPAVAREETSILKQLQAKAQRDAPDNVNSLKQSRRAVYESVENGIVAAREVRIKREIEEKEHRRLMEERQRLEKEEKRVELQREHAKRLQERKDMKQLEMKKQLPKNMAMWQEVAFLMTELAKMKKEEKMWNEVDKQLDVKAEGLSQGKLEKVNMSFQEIGDKILHYSNTSQEIKERVESAMHDIHLSSLRIKRATTVVENQVSSADQIRSGLFEKYTRDHQFHGYTGIRDPKSLIRILSQD
mmetsp:Transcript_26116/g.39521  ORF Transcript_26116/g.39521 Transcript_26116/m.39521 type:complete len:355 (+) Transcript_26116:89-1153(+)